MLSMPRKIEIVQKENQDTPIFIIGKDENGNCITESIMATKEEAEQILKHFEKNYENRN